MFEIFRFETKVRSSSFDKKRAVIFAILAVISSIILVTSALSGIGAEKGIYTSNFNLPPLFFKSNNPDIILDGNKVFVKNTWKSFAAYADFKKIYRENYEKDLYEKYGEKAFPISVFVVKVKTNQIGYPKTKNLRSGVIGSVSSVKSNVSVGVVKVSKVSKGVSSKNVNTFKTFKQSNEGVPPEYIHLPNLIKRMMIAFIVLIPIYFAFQAVSSSFMEDKITKRLDTIFVAAGFQRTILEKMLPYFSISIAIISVISLAFGIKVFVLSLPIVVFMIPLGVFTAFISRSYREATFLNLALSAFITVYITLPAIFPVYPLNMISPFAVTKLDFYDYLTSTLQYYVMGFVLTYLCLNSKEVMYSQLGILNKILELGKSTVRNYKSIVVVSMLSIPFVFVIEFFSLSLIFFMSNPFILVIICIAVIEEFFKSIFIYSAIKNGLNKYFSAILSAFGFFLGEKTILFSFISIKFAKLVFLPLIVHVLASITFVIALKMGFRKALLSASAVHATYDGVILWMLLR